MQVFVGTSGWAYSWNEGGNLEWYAKHSKLNAIELNMSFYRFPFPSVIKGWSKKASDLRWVVKVNKIITHINRFEKDSLEAWKRFEEIFSPLEQSIDFYLFQLPPSMKPESKKSIEDFIKKVKGLKKDKIKFAIEFRNLEWFKEKEIRWAEKLGFVVVSVDAPKLPRDIYKTHEIVYLRMHGRSAWYRHEYSQEELKEIAKNILKTKPTKVYVFFNNNHAMLKNAREMMKILNKI
ncbi:MAG: DUF72 domain-containing protein [Candidatus Aenigmatarchaeota archaeon]